MYRYILFFILSTPIFGFSQDNTIYDAIRNKDIKKVELIIENQPKQINNKNNKGFTPLILASYYNNQEAVKLLLKNNANVDVISPMGTALMAATYKGNVAIVKMLLAYQADVNLSDEKGTTALHYACLFNNTTIAKLILKKKPKRNIKDVNSKTPLDYAVLSDNIELIKLFNHE